MPGPGALAIPPILELLKAAALATAATQATKQIGQQVQQEPDFLQNLIPQGLNSFQPQFGPMVPEIVQQIVDFGGGDFLPGPTQLTPQEQQLPLTVPSQAPQIDQTEQTPLSLPGFLQVPVQEPVEQFELPPLPTETFQPDPVLKIEDKDISPLKDKDLPKRLEMMGNFLTPLSKYTDQVFTEQSVDFIANQLAVDRIGEVFVTNDRNLALGQGKNKGVLIELKTEKLKGQVNQSKPSFEVSARGGSAEFMTHSTTSSSDFGNSIERFTISKDAQAEKRDFRTINGIFRSWERIENEDGSATFINPVFLK